MVYVGLVHGADVAFGVLIIVDLIVVFSESRVFVHDDTSDDILEKHFHEDQIADVE
jgi:hypothetical protein